ncbi:hypothetical protein ACJX0J_019354, partial [Zea mays]
LRRAGARRAGERSNGFKTKLGFCGAQKEKIIIITSWDIITSVDLWEDGGSDDGYVLVKQEDVVDGMTSFMAACLVALHLPPDQLQKALRKTFLAEKKKSKIRKAWDETKVIYNVASWGRNCCW